MQQVERARLGIRELVGPWVPLAIVAACVLLSHVSAVERCALPIYGFDGAEYIEHGTRGHILNELRSIPVVLRPVAFPRLLRAADSAYPPLLHLIAAYWGSIFGGGIPAAVHLNLIFVAMLAAAVALGTRHLASIVGSSPASWWAASLAACTVLLTPAVYGSARRYYYDLPMTAWIAVAFAALCRAPSSKAALVVASMATTGALLTKWTAGFTLVPLWLLAVVLALRETSGSRRRRGLVRLAIAAAAVAILCLPVLLNSTLFRTATPTESGTAGQTPAAASRASSFDIAIGQTGSLPRTSTGGPAQPLVAGERMTFYGTGLVSVVLGPLVSMALLALAAMGWPGWRGLLLGLALCLPTCLMLVSPAVTVADERFVLPMVPLLVASACAMWDRGPVRVPRLAAAGLLFVAGLVQLASWDGRLPLGPTWTGRSSLGHRGWSRLADTPCSPARAYEELGERACASSWQGGEVIVSEKACEHMGISWMLDRACPEVGYRSVPDEVALDRLRRAQVEQANPLSIVVSTNIADPAWPEPHLQVWLPQDSNSPEDQLGLYLYEGGGRRPAEGKAGH